MVTAAPAAQTPWARSKLTLKLRANPSGEEAALNQVKGHCSNPSPDHWELVEEPGWHWLNWAVPCALLGHHLHLFASFPVCLLHLPALQAVCSVEQGFLVVSHTTLPLHQPFLLLMCSTAIPGTREAELGTAAARDRAVCPQHHPSAPSLPSAWHFHRFGGQGFFGGGQEVQAAQAAWPLTQALLLLLLTLQVINMGRTVRGK